MRVLLLSLLLSLLLAAAGAQAQDWIWIEGKPSRVLPPSPLNLETLKSAKLREHLRETPPCRVDAIWQLVEGRFWLTGFQSCRGPLDLKTVYGWPISPNNDPLRSDWLNATVHTHRGALLCGSGKPGSESLWAEHLVFQLDSGRVMEQRRLDRRKDPRVPAGPGPHPQCKGKVEPGLAPWESMPIAVQPAAQTPKKPR